VSLQLGLSHEAKFGARDEELPVAAADGSGVFVHPTLMVGRSQQVLFFAQTTLPVHQAWGNPAEREQFRLGAGVIVKLGQ
jgi:hypothetical protein